jgi:hypothetical protein
MAIGRRLPAEMQTRWKALAIETTLSLAQTAGPPNSAGETGRRQSRLRASGHSVVVVLSLTVLPLAPFT